MAEKKTLSQIKSGVFQRGLALAKVSVSAGARAASHAVGNIFVTDEEKPERFKALLMSQIHLLTQELGQLKGSVMKVGQMLSMYGEHFLPPEVNSVLKSLQNQSPPLEWKSIEKVLKRQLGEQKLALLDIEPEPVASASLGQVHRARRRSDGLLIALKIQYPGVDEAIDGDIRALRSILSMSKLIPRGQDYEQIFKEVRQMLHQEVDYTKELELTQQYAEALGSDPRWIFPKVVPEFCTKRVLATEFQEGVAVDGPEVQELVQERRNAIGLAFAELYAREIFEAGMVQTDPHFGNYRVKLGQNGEPDRLILLDFGAVRKFPKAFLTPYRKMARSAFYREEEAMIRAAIDVGLLREGDSSEQVDFVAQLGYLISEPVSLPGMKGISDQFFDALGNYDWGSSDLPKRAARLGPQIAFAFKLRPPPKEFIFLDRKLGGVFIFLSVLKAKVRARDVFEKYLV